MKFFISRGTNKHLVQPKKEWYLSILDQPQDAEAYWERKIAPNLSDDQKLLLAEQLFCYVWTNLGRNVAMDQVASPAQQLQLAQARFDKGCSLCKYQLFESALMEIEKSRQIQEANGAWCHEEMEIQWHYAKGTILQGLREYDKALSEFRQAWRISCLKLGCSHMLSQASQFMIETVLRRYHCDLLEIHNTITILRQAIVHEKEGDFFQVAGDFDLAIYEYRQSLFEYQRYQDEPEGGHTLLEQAEIRCKMAKTLELHGKHSLAQIEWATALSLYQSFLGNRHAKTIETMSGLVRNHTLFQHK
jgi:tetratricopeptide (TPR) repeat protein